MATDPIVHPADIQAGAIHSGNAIARGRMSSVNVWADVLSRRSTKLLFFLSCDLVALLASHSLAQALTGRWMRLSPAFLNPPGYYLFYAPFFTAMLCLLGCYRSPELRRPEKEIELLFKGVSISFVALACANFVFFKSLGFSRYLLVVWYALALLFFVAVRAGLRGFYASLWKRGWARQKALLVGSAEGFVDFEARLAIQRYQGYTIAGALLDPAAHLGNPPGFALPILGSMDDWEEIARQERIRLVIVRLPESSPHSGEQVASIVDRCRRLSIDVEVYSRVFGPPHLRFERDEFSGCLRLSPEPAWSRALQKWIKSSFDVLIGVAGSVAALLLIPFVAMRILREDPGPIFHSREYVATDGSVRHFLKFRTMVRNAEQVLEGDPELKSRFESSFKLKDDPRILRSGRFLRKYSLDEFPQFFSILAGHLTFVGPRAITPAARERYGALAPKLLSMTPGLTGFWQVMGRQTTTFEEKIQMDMFYIDHWSIWLDLVIVAKTLWTVLRAEGAY